MRNWHKCVFFVSTISLLASACGSDDDDGSFSTGGTSSAGAGPKGTGGARNTGGSTATGGATTTAGGSASGGSNSTGGSIASGGSGGVVENPCAVTFRLKGNDAEQWPRICYSACWLTVTDAAGATVYKNGTEGCDWFINREPSYALWDGRVADSLECMPSANYVAKMCAYKPDHAADILPGPRPQTSPPDPSCTPSGEEVCIEVPFQYPSPEPVIGTIEFGQ